MNRFKLEIKWGLIFVGMTLLWLVLERIGGLHGKHIDKHAFFTNLIMIPAVIIFVLALREKRDKVLGGAMSFKQGFVTGLIITFIITVLSPITQSIVSLVITPGYFQNAIEYAVREGKMSREMAEGYFSLRSYIIQGLMGSPIMGTITSAAVAFFVKKAPEKGNS